MSKQDLLESSGSDNSDSERKDRKAGKNSGKAKGKEKKVFVKTKPESNDVLTINSKFAQHFEQKERRKELEKNKRLLEEGDDESDSESDSGSSSDDDYRVTVGGGGSSVGRGVVGVQMIAAGGSLKRDLAASASASSHNADGSVSSKRPKNIL